MRAGRRRHKVTLYSVTDGKDGDGAPTETEVVLRTAWAAIEPLQGRELFQAQAVHAAVTGEARFDWLDAQDLTPKHRIGLGARRWNIVAVMNMDERNREVRCLVEERV